MKNGKYLNLKINLFLENGAEPFVKWRNVRDLPSTIFVLFFYYKFHFSKE